MLGALGFAGVLVCGGCLDLVGWWSVMENGWRGMWGGSWHDLVELGVEFALGVLDLTGVRCCTLLAGEHAAGVGDCKGGAHERMLWPALNVLMFAGVVALRCYGVFQSCCRMWDNKQDDN